MTKISLDTKSFKAISAKSRISILEKLNERRMTLSELSKKLSLKNPTVKEHCNLLLDAELVKQIDEGYKWKYYELTNKGKQIVHPTMFTEIKSLVVLSFAAIIFTSFILFGFTTNANLFGATHDFDSQPIMQSMAIEKTLTIDQPIQESDILKENNVDVNIYTIDYNFFAISLIFSLLIGIFAGWVVARKS